MITQAPVGAPLSPLNHGLVDGQSAPPRTAIFLLIGHFWRTWFDGVEAFLKDSVGMRYIHRLLEHRWQSLPCHEMIAAMHGNSFNSFPQLGDREHNHTDENSPRTFRIHVNQIVTPEARRTIQSRLSRLREEATLLKMHHPEALNDVDDEIDQLERYLREAGYGTIAAKFTTNQERARKSVLNAITRAVGRIKPVNPPLAAHLDDCIHTGTTCLYSPNRQIDWVLK
jgi:hypothetical protein